jgi:hypothetical protein
MIVNVDIPMARVVDIHVSVDVQVCVYIAIYVDVSIFANIAIYVCISILINVAIHISISVDVSVNGSSGAVACRTPVPTSAPRMSRGHKNGSKNSSVRHISVNVAYKGQTRKRQHKSGAAKK